MRLRPPFVALGLLLAAWAVDYATGAGPVIPERFRWAGALAIAGGLALVAWPIVLFRRAGTSHDPYETPTRLVASGPYRFTRNPMYVGVAAILLGIAVLVGTTPFFFVPFLFVLLMNTFRVPREEAALEAALGDEFRAYKGRVRRWI